MPVPMFMAKHVKILVSTQSIIMQSFVSTNKHIYDFIVIFGEKMSK